MNAKEFETRDTRKLVVGQVIRMKSGPYSGITGRVVKVTLVGVEVEALEQVDIVTPAGVLLGFNRYGTEQTSGENARDRWTWVIDWEGMEQASLWERRCSYMQSLFQSLVIGQEVPMRKGVDVCQGKVVNITWRGIEVVIEDGPNVTKGEPLRFSSKGYPFEFNPWELDVPAEHSN
jgi:RNase P/RNase MRP subunit p29